MFKRENLLVLLFLLVFNYSLGFSQNQNPNSSLFAPTKAFSLLDPSKLKISNTYSFGYFSSGRSSGSIGMYMSTIEYQIYQPLTVKLGLGYVHPGFIGNNNFDVNSRILSNFSLRYRPSSNFSLSIDVLTLPEYYYLNRYYDPFGR